MTSRKAKDGIKRARACVFLFIGAALLALFIKNPTLTARAAADALSKCGAILIPSLFPLMTASEIAVESDAAERLTRPLASILSKPLRIKKEASAPLLLGLFGGYTTSVCGALSLLRSKKISKRDCERLIAISSLPSLPFLTGFVGSSVFKSTADGWILWLITVITSLLIGFFTRPKRARAEYSAACGEDMRANAGERSLSKIIVGAISHSATSMILICACVIFFSALAQTLKAPLEALGLPENIEMLILGSLEITGGTLSCADIGSNVLKRTVCAFFVGWSGLSVHFQIISLCDGYGLSFKRYFIFKALHGVLCALLAFAIFVFKF